MKLKKYLAIPILALSLIGTCTAFAEYNYDDSYRLWEMFKVERKPGIVTKLGKQKLKDADGNEYTLIMVEDNILISSEITKNDVKHIKDFNIPDNIPAILEDGIKDIPCDKITIPKTVTHIKNRCLERNDTKEFVIDEENPSFCSVDGVAYTKDMRVMVGYPKNKEEKIYKVPDSVECMFASWSGNYPQIKYIIYPPNLSGSSGGVLWYPADAVYLPTEQTAWTYFTGVRDEYFSGEYYLEVKKNAFGKDDPLVIYMPKDIRYTEEFKNDKGVLFINENGYTLGHVELALKMSLGISDTQPDLRTYDEEKKDATELLFDVDKNKEVDLGDVEAILKNALGIS